MCLGVEAALKCVDVDFSHDGGDARVPRTLAEAMASPEKNEWKKAMAAEMQSMKEDQVWYAATRRRRGKKKCVSSKWVFDLKKNAKGEIVRYKARLVARGFTQREGVDYDKTFSPVLQPALLRSLMAIAAKENWEIDQVDVKTAFLYGDLEEEIYLKLPDGSVRRLRKAIYGLKQAGRQFRKR